MPGGAVRPIEHVTAGRPRQEPLDNTRTRRVRAATGIAVREARPAFPGGSGEVDPVQRLRDAHRLLAPLRLDGEAALYLHGAAAQVLGAEDLGARAQAHADPHDAGE